MLSGVETSVYLMNRFFDKLRMTSNLDFSVRIFKIIMMIELFRGQVRLNIEEPQEGYGETRFDHTGKVIQLWWKGIPMCTSELAENNSEQQGKGFFNEFGISKPIGYDDTEIGDYFPKIGVGMLKKENNQPYDFFHQYECLPYEFATEVNDSGVTFKCINRDQKYAFHLEKKVTLTDTGFVIDYQLNNKGEVIFNTSEYVHNFLSPGNRKLSNNTQIVVGQDINARQFSNGLNPNNCLSYSGNQINWGNTPGSDFFFENISKPMDNVCNWKLTDINLNVSISEMRVKTPALIKWKVNLSFLTRRSITRLVIMIR
jgi:hypothetical protein